MNDSERDAAFERLREQRGHMTLGELAERGVRLMDATTSAELEAALEDLPTGSSVPASSPGHWLWAVCGGVARKQRWRPRPTGGVAAALGGAHLDLRQAVVDGDSLELEAYAVL